MKDWVRIAEGLGLEIPPPDLERAAQSLARVEAVFQPLIDRIPLETEPAFVVVREPEESA